MKRLYFALTLTVVASLLLTACGGPTALTQPTAQPTPEPTPQPTPTPLVASAQVPAGTAAPIVVQRTPERGEELPLDGTIELVFDRAMDQAAVERALSINPKVKGSFKWPDERTVRFQPAKALDRDSRYEVELGTGAQDADGLPLAEAYRFHFTTVGYLEVTQVIPAPDSQDVEADSTITVMFNRPVVPLTTLEQQEDLPQPVTFDPPVEGSGEWLNTSIYVFTPDGPLAGGTRYTARVKAGLTDTTGGLLEEDYQWSFSTQPPAVVWTTPDDGATLVAPTTEVRIAFNQPVDCQSAEDAFSLQAKGLLGREIKGTFECSADTLVFTPAEMLAFDKTYQVHVARGVKSATGGEGMRQDYQWQFTTVPLPRIVGTNPGDGEKAAHPYTDFRITFNAPIDPDTVMPNLTMTPPFSPTEVYTYFGPWDNTFVLSFGAKPSTDYEVRIGPDIADPYGNKTGQKMTVRFRTRPLDPMVRLRVPDQVGTYNADDPARLFVEYLNTSRLDLELYRLELDDFFQAQRDWWEYRPPASGLVRQWSVPVETPLNEAQYAPIELVEGGGKLSPGLYLLDVDSPDVERDRWRHRHLLVVSQINLTLKVTTDEMLVWATELATGRPVSDLKLKARDERGASFGTATTDADGLAHFKLERRRRSLYAIGAEPFTMGCENWNPGVSPWEFGFNYEGKQNFRAHVYTERPIYRAGQTVYFRGIIRAEDDVHYSLPDLGPVTVRINDAAGEEVYNEQLKLDEFGTFYSELDLPEGATLGVYYLSLQFADTGAGATFQVAAYRPPEFEVVVTPKEPEIPAGQRTQATVNVSYFFGGRVADAPVEWNVLAETYRFRPPQFGRYRFTDVDDPWICWDCWWWTPPGPGPVVLSGSGRTDEKGQLVIELPWDIVQKTVEEDHEGPVGSRKLVVEATVSGSDGQVISGRGEIIVHQGEFYIGLAPQQYVGQAGEEMSVDIITVDWEAERLPNQKLKVAVYRREWVNTFIEDEIGGGRWEWETKDTLVFEDTVTTDENAEAVTTFTPEQGGSYHVVVNGRDEAERLVQSSIFLWVSGREYVSWRRENNDRINLIADKGSYKVGETAEILIPSPFSGEQWALITVERGNIIHRQVLQLESNSQVWRLPITTDHVPNIYVSAVIVKGQDADNKVATYKVGYAALSVEPEPQQLTIELKPSVEKAGPGDTVSYEVQATDHTGEPVATAFSLDLVDKAILTLSPRPSGAIVEAFYGRRGLGVSTSSGLAISINRLVLEQWERYEGEMRDEMATMERGGGGPAEEMPALAAPMPTTVAKAAEMEAAAPPPGVALREEFADTAYWDATVVTDRSGRASVEIELPDNLTTWVFRGVGITADTEVGEATTELLVTKPLLVRPVTPRFFVVDDQAQLAAILNNNTDEDLEVQVALSSTGLVVHDDEEQTVTIAAGSEGKVTWQVTVEDVEKVDVIFSAVAGEYSDAARPRLTTGPEGSLLVHRYSAPEVVGTGGQLTEEGTRTEVVALPPKYDDRKGELLVQLDPSLAAGMRDGLSYLEHFPYECAEQTVSRFLPNVLTYRALKDLGITDPELEEKLPGLVEQALNKLYLQQNDDGGWGWWHSGQSRPHLTAYVIFAMDKAQEAGFEVRDGVIARGLEYLRGQVVRARELESYREANRQAFILYVMAEAGDVGYASEYTGNLFDNREKLSHYGRAFLALTLDMIDAEDKRIPTLLSDLNNAAILSATGAHWEEKDYDWWAMNTDTRSTAVILDTLTRLDPENELIPNVVRWLMVARREGIWETTQETAWALIALTDWMVETGELQGEYDYLVRLNGDELASGAVDAENIDQSIKLRVAVAELLREQGNRLDISRGEGPGRLYYTAHLRVYLPVEEIDPVNRGIIVYRQYQQADCTAGIKCPEASEAQVGDVIQVKLTIVAPHDLYYVVVEDPLPAGAEAIDVSLATTSLLDQHPALRRQAEDSRWGEWYYWWWNWYSRTEMRDDKVVLFADYLSAGTYEYTYTFRATLPGQYQVIPTVASEFYFPEVFGRSDGRLFAITEAE
ncbi:MAG: Ig-like domain-containing protein [Anaerolineae bacterium]